jgi:hypothetical protein
MSTIKIVLDASTLQLLMDKDPEFQVAVNQAALAWLRKAIIKPVTDNKLQEALSACRKELTTHFEKQFEKSYAVQKWPYSVSEDFKKKVQVMGNDMIESIIKENLQEKINAENLESEFRSGMDKLLERFSERLDNCFTSGKINHLVREIISNKMTTILEKVQG